MSSGRTQFLRSGNVTSYLLEDTQFLTKKFSEEVYIDSQLYTNPPEFPKTTLPRYRPPVVYDWGLLRSTTDYSELTDGVKVGWGKVRGKRSYSTTVSFVLDLTYCNDNSPKKEDFGSFGTVRK